MPVYLLVFKTSVGRRPSRMGSIPICSRQNAGMILLERVWKMLSAKWGVQIAGMIFQTDPSLSIAQSDIFFYVFKTF